MAFSVARKLSGRRPSKTRSPYAKSWTIAAPVSAANAHRLGEDARRRGDGAGVGRVVEVDGGDVVPRRLVPLRRPAAFGVEAERLEPRAGERDAGRVVGIAGIREQHAAAALGEHHRQLDERRLRSGHDRDLGLWIELDAVDGSVALGDRLPQRGQAAKRGVAVCPLLERHFGEALDDVGRRPDLGIPAAEIHERLPCCLRPPPLPGRGVR